MFGLLLVVYFVLFDLDICLLGVVLGSVVFGFVCLLVLMGLGCMIGVISVLFYLILVILFSVLIYLLDVLFCVYVVFCLLFIVWLLVRYL